MSPKTTPTNFRRRKISDMVADDLRRWIAQENLQPGDRLPNERALLEHYNCSKGTIREALKSLEVQGLVKMVTGPNGGPEVCTVSLDVIMQQLRTFLHFQKFDFQQVYSLRQSLEVMLAKSVVGRLHEQHLTKLQSNITEYELLRAQGDRQGARRTELEFHDILTQLLDFMELRPADDWPHVRAFSIRITDVNLLSNTASDFQGLAMSVCRHQHAGGGVAGLASVGETAQHTQFHCPG